MARWTLVGVGVAAVVAAGQLPLEAERLPGVAGAAGTHPSHQQSSAIPAVSTASAARALLDQYCVTCHNDRTRMAGLTLETMDVSRVGAGAAMWEHVVRRVRADAMPPAGRPRPDAATSRAFVSWLETELDRAARAKPDPGRPAIHRLNRVEYANAIRDLFGLDVDVRALLPADNEHHGFDNIAEVLSVSPTLIRTVPVRGAANQPACCRRPGPSAGGRDLSDPRRAGPGRAGQRRPAVWLARWGRDRAQLPGRWRVHRAAQPSEARVWLCARARSAA